MKSCYGCRWQGSLTTDKDAMCCHCSRFVQDYYKPFACADLTTPKVEEIHCGTCYYLLERKCRNPEACGDFSKWKPKVEEFDILFKSEEQKNKFEKALKIKEEKKLDYNLCGDEIDYPKVEEKCEHEPDYVKTLKTHCPKCGERYDFPISKINFIITCLRYDRKRIRALEDRIKEMK